MADWIIRSKLKPSVQLHKLVVREPLISRLNGALKARAAIVHAPAGCGKSTLLAQWQDRLERRGVPVAWLSLDDYDTDSFQFLTYLMQACTEGSFCDGFEFPDSPQSFSGAPALANRAAVVTALGRCQGPHVVILDDFHRAGTEEIHDVVNTLLADLPANIHIVISTREYPNALSLADLRVRDALIEITQSDLQFSEQDIQAYLGSLIVPTDSPDWARELFERTEGWPIALQTVRRWIREGASLSDTLQEISGRSSDLVDYFLEQVFEKLDRNEQRFLLRTSILERVNGELGDLLCNWKGSWEMLESLERRDLFVNSLDRDRAWYRYHRLFSEFLQERLRRQPDSLLRELHVLAADWFNDQGHVTEAIQHALRSRDPEMLADMMEQLGGWHYALRGHIGIVDRVLQITSAEVTQRHPRLWLAHIFLTVRLGELEPAESEFALFAERYLKDDSTDRQLQCEGQIIECLIGRYGDSTVSDQEIRQLQNLSEILSPDNHVMNAVCSNLLCALYGRLGQLDEAIAAGDQAILHFREMGSLWGEVFIYFHEGFAYMAQARIRDAEALYREGYNLAVEQFGEDSDSAAIGRAFLAEVAYEKNNLQEASQLLERALPHIERFDAWIDVYLAAYSTAIKLARANGDKQAVLEIARRAKSTAANRGLARLSRAINAYLLIFEQNDRILQQDNWSAAEDFHLNPDPEPTDPVMRHLSSSVAARDLLLAGQFNEAITLLKAEAEQARRGKFIRSFITLSLLLATAHWKKGQHEAANAAFEAALLPALFEGLRRPFIDEGAMLAGVISELTLASKKRRGNRLREKFLTELAVEIDSVGQKKQNEHSPLSPREQQVLRFLTQGHSNREIAEAMTLSINTVKFHIKNIFEKLAVNTREDAVSVTILRRLL